MALLQKSETSLTFGARGRNISSFFPHAAIVTPFSREQSKQQACDSRLSAPQ